MRKITLFFSLLVLTITTAFAQSYTYSLPNGYTDNSGEDGIVPLTSEELMAKTEATYLVLKCVAKNNSKYFKGTSSGTPSDFSNINAEYVFIWEPIGDGKFYLKKADGNYLQTANEIITLGSNNAAKFYTTQPILNGNGETDYNDDGSSDFYYEGSEYFVRFVNESGKWINVQQEDGPAKYNSGPGSFTFLYAYEVTATEIIEESATQEEKDAALAIIDGKKGTVGYPVDNVIDAYIESINNAAIPSDIEDAKANLFASTEINMPEDGKAYKIKYEINDGTQYYLYDNGSKIAINKTANTALTDNSDIFVFRALGEGKYALANNRGKYLVYYADEKQGAGNVSNGLADTYELGDKDAEVTFIQASTVNVTNGSATAEQLFGGFAMQAYNSEGSMFYMLAKHSSNNQFHSGGSTDFYYESELSSVFYLEETTYANTPVLNDIADNTLINVEGSMATFSAPFATVLPDGVTAYTATDNGSYVSLNAIDGAVPANTGVILVGAAGTGKITMKPAAGEAEAEISSNALGNSAGAAITLTEGQHYLLGAVNGVPGFYLSGAGTLAMNKAYLAIPVQGNSVVVRFPGTTDINEVKGENGEVNAIYDLTGRRVEAITVPGIYIVNGKKVLVK